MFNLDRIDWYYQATIAAALVATFAFRQPIFLVLVIALIVVWRNRRRGLGPILRDLAIGLGWYVAFVVLMFGAMFLFIRP